MRELMFTAVMILTLSAVGLAVEKNPAAIEPVPHQTVVYKTVDDISLKLHLFNPQGHQAGDKAAAIVFFFGGGWNSGTPSQFYGQSAYLASRGVVAACAEYRVKGRHKTSPAECVKDGKSAVRWMRTHAQELGINPAMLAAGGGSAGGHIAAAIGSLQGFEEAGEDLSVSSRPNALVLFNPVYDNGPGGFGHASVKAYWQEFSPLHNISAKTPPTIVFLGDTDKLIPVATAQRYKALMEKAGVRSELHLYQGQPHGFFNVARYSETLLETDKFLTSLGYLKGAPTLQLQ